MFRRIVLFLFLILFPVLLCAQTSGSRPIPQIHSKMIDQMEGTFTGTMQGTPIVDVLGILSRQTELNFLISSKVQGTVTANFQKVVVKSAFLSMLKDNDLYYMEEGGLIHILTADEYKEDLQKQYLETRIFDASIIDIKNIKSVLDPILTPGVGSFSVDSQSSKVVVTDIRQNFDLISRVLHELSTLPRMVEIEVKIIQVDLQEGNEFGINWSALDLGHAVNIVTGLIPTTGIGGQTIKIAGTQNDKTTGITLTALISALGKNYHTHLISQPRILAVNRKEADIHIGENVPYVKSVTTDTVGKQTSQVEFVDVGIKIVIKPVITDSREVLLNTKGEVSSYSEYYVNTEEKAPKKKTTEFSCDSVVAEGETLIIGGLIEAKKEQNIEKIPLLGDIPFLGYLFSHTTEQVKRSELVIFLTPRIMEGGESNLDLKGLSDSFRKVYQSKKKFVHTLNR